MTQGRRRVHSHPVWRPLDRGVAMLASRLLVALIVVAVPFRVWADPPLVGNIVVNSSDDFDGTDDNPNQICTLREAINNADNHTQWSTDCPSGGTVQTNITFAVDHVALNPAYGEISVNSSVYLQGPVTIQGPIVGSRSRLLHVRSNGDLLLDRVSLQNGSENGASGGAILSEGTLTMILGTVQNNRADRGGALALYGKSSLYNVEFLANDANLEGGAVWIASSPEIAIRASTFNNNRTEAGAGSAIYVALGNANTSIDQTAFFANLAGGLDGNGTVYASGTLNLKHSVFAHNTVEGAGGGGALYLTNGIIATLESDEFTENTIEEFNVGASGGAIHADGGIVLVDKSNITANQAFVGGGVYAAPGTFLSLVNTTVAKNRAETAGVPSRSESGNGAGIYGDDAEVGLFNVTVKDNVGRTQLTSQGPNATMRISNSVVWSTTKSRNCGGSGAFDTLDLENFQSIDAAGGSCPMPVVVKSAGKTFDPEETFVDPLGPPALPLTHHFWRPKTGSDLGATGDPDACEDHDTVMGEDELGDPRPACDIGAIETR
jgi:CSLREA domain-containing protein